MGQNTSRLNDGGSAQEISKTQSRTHFTLVEVDRLHAYFSEIAKASPERSDAITKDQFAAALEGLDIKGIDPGDPFVTRLFEVFDRDRSNMVDFKEFLSAISLCCRGTIKERVRFSFQLYDASETGTITKGDMGTCLRSMSHTLDSEGLHENEDIETFVDEVFQEVDANHDDELSIEEFTNAVMKHPVLLTFFDVFLNSEKATGFDKPMRYFVVVDGGHAGRKAFDHAVRTVHGGKHTLLLIALHRPLDPTLRPPFMPRQSYAKEHSDLVTRLRGVLAEYEEECALYNIDVESCGVAEVKDTDAAASMVVQQAHEHDADVIVLGHSEERSSNPIGMAPPASACMVDSACSILTVK